MKQCGIIFSSLIIIVKVLTFQGITCHPIEEKFDNKLDVKDETRYPNGTVIGRYFYKDEEGNPISVKYYADRDSYGVELNSFKTFKTMVASTTKEGVEKMKSTNDYMKPIEPLLDLASEIMSFNNKHNKFLLGRTDTEGQVKENVAKTSYTTQSPDISAKVSRPDYETFYQNEVKAPKQCEKEKVRVYLVKDNRKARSAFDKTRAELCYEHS